MHGRSGLVVPLLLAAFSTYLLIGILTMEVPEGTDFPGPKFFPGILMVAGYLLAALLVLHYLRSPEHPEELSESTYRTHSDWSAVIWSVAGLLVFALTIEFLGWILAAAVLAGVGTFALLRLVALVTPLRMTERQETQGVDLAAHQEEGYQGAESPLAAPVFVGGD